MKRLFLVLFLFGLISPVFADLGEADLEESGSNATSTKIYDALCGKEPRKDCKVKFLNGRLIVNNGKGISKEQLVEITREIECEPTFWWNCNAAPEVNAYKVYRISYSSNNALKTGIITFHHYPTDQMFKSDLQIWMGKPLREVGPSIRIDAN